MALNVHRSPFTVHRFAWRSQDFDETSCVEGKRMQSFGSFFSEEIKRTLYVQVCARRPVNGER
jgi:hypothetical protein